MAVKVVSKGIVSKIAMCGCCEWRYEGLDENTNTQAKTHAQNNAGHKVNVQTVISTTYGKGHSHD